ncbi:hypothetical protein Tco_0262045 [Tanacetum coccineum]
MADHSHIWYDEAITRERINDCFDYIDTKKLKENIHAIQVSCKVCERAHLTKEFPLKKEDKVAEKFTENTDLNLRALDTTTQNLHVKPNQLTQMVLTNAEERVNAEMKMGKKYMKEPVPRNFLVVQPYVPPTPFPGHLKKRKDNPYKTRETICMIGIPKKIQEDEGVIDDGWDITIKDVERIWKILTPTIHTLPNLEPVAQLYMLLGPVHDELKVKEELEYNIPIQDGMLQPLTP